MKKARKSRNVDYDKNFVGVPEGVCGSRVVEPAAQSRGVVGRNHESQVACRRLQFIACFTR